MSPGEGRHGRWAVGRGPVVKRLKLEIVLLQPDSKCRPPSRTARLQLVVIIVCKKQSKCLRNKFTWLKYVELATKWPPTAPYAPLNTPLAHVWLTNWRSMLWPLGWSRLRSYAPPSTSTTDHPPHTNRPPLSLCFGRGVNFYTYATRSVFISCQTLWRLKSVDAASPRYCCFCRPPMPKTRNLRKNYKTRL